MGVVCKCMFFSEMGLVVGLSFEVCMGTLNGICYCLFCLFNPYKAGAAVAT